MGIAAGATYVPSMAVIAQYFERKRALAMVIVACGSSFGASIHPIMLNNLFVSIGFANGVRASAGMISGLLLIACLLMRQRFLPQKRAVGFLECVKKLSHDSAYVASTLGYA